ncbi:Non-specific serine/threonine protein kinase [Handroanthus impetiginosus]|uniref:Non-specific serine/threonine protein kinase n=1 Tax=Handroanthus impetiginosus TaxID=429701 RepID=A0A2G9HGR5_9LAMI|nr:Non-specific serine/threonine protein kinase [Handroanthus impetiginosus]
MEVAQGDVYPGNGDGVTESPLSGNFPSETLVGNMGSENRVEESYEEGDGGEIMVEVVGSDVFVGGVSSHKEGDFESGEVGVLEGPWENKEGPQAQNFLDAMDVLTEGDGNKMGESEVGLSESKDERNSAFTAEVGVSLRGSVDVEVGAVTALSSREVGNLGIEARTVPSSVATESVTVQTEEVTELTSVVVGEEKTIQSQAVDKDGAEVVTPETLNDSLEADVGGKVEVAEKEEVLSSNDNAASDDHLSADSLSADSVISHGVASEAHDAKILPSEVSVDPNIKDLENVKVKGVESIIGEVGAHTAGARGETLATDSSKDDGSFKVNTEPTNPDGDNVVEAKCVDEKEFSAAESKDQILEDVLVPDVQEENQGSLNELNEVKFETDDQIDGVSLAIPESIHENSLASESGETIGAEFDVVLDFKDEASNIDLPDLSRAENDECLKTDGGVETDTIHQNDVLSSEPNETADEGGTAELVEYKVLDVELQADTEGNQQNLTNPGCPGGEQIVEADFGLHVSQPVITSTVNEVMDDQKVAISQVEAADKIDSEIPEQSLEFRGNAEILALDGSTDNMDLKEKETSSCLEGETADDPVVDSEVGFEDVVEENCLPQNTEQEILVQTVETSNQDVNKLENINVMPNEVASITAVSDSSQVNISLEITEMAESRVSTTNSSLLDGGVIEENLMCDVAASSGEVNKSRESDDYLSKTDGAYIEEGHTSETKPMDVDEGCESDIMYNSAKEADSILGTEEPASETDKLMLSNEETVKSASSLRMNQPVYLSPPEKVGCFGVSDLVWGKVQSHPWWPGQIFDPADASEKAVKYYKKDSYLVAYFGDGTFVWNDASVLKPFGPHFSQIEKQNNSEAFQNAVNCALEEVSRRLELGLACSCIPKDAYRKIESQVVDNVGVREESSLRNGVDQSSRAASFEPDKLLEYIIDLAPRAVSGADRLDLVIAQAQLSAFCRFKGYRSPTEFPSPGELLENDADTEQISDEMAVLHKRKHTLEDDSESRKERSLTELMGDGEYLPDAESGRKRIALDPVPDGLEKRETISTAKVSTSMSQTPKPSFKIGECIQRVASQLTGSTSLVLGNNNEAVVDGSPKIYENSESFSVDEMVSQLQLVAQDPKKGPNFQKNIHTFFLGFRSSIASNRRVRKKKGEEIIGGSGEDFEFDDVNDSYWTDRIVQNYSEEQLLHNSENGAATLQVVPFDAEKSVKPGRKPNSRKRYSMGIYPTAATEVDESIKRRKQESSPAELILNFAERNFVPSEINLNKMFRRFGPLMESETEVDHESGRAKVIFKRGADAEVARNSSEKFNIFGPALVNYQIGYSPLISVKILPLEVPQRPEDANLML